MVQWLSLIISLVALQRESEFRDWQRKQAIEQKE